MKKRGLMKGARVESPDGAEGEDEEEERVKRISGAGSASEERYFGT